ncbi:MAG: glycosyltransferase family 2 protein [Phycisphaerae bacterium]|nr:glycosyltransferase family 2 protein [Phycisphaerae bacterium]
MKLSIIIVSWNVSDDLQACLSSLRDNPPSAAFEQILVDNNSSDATVETVKKNFPEVKIIENSENKGFATANNQGIGIATGQYVLLLNPDTIVHPGALDTLIEFLDKNPDAGACGPKLINDDGTIQASVRRFPTYRGVLYSHTVCRLLGLFRTPYRKWMMKDFRYDKQTDVDQLMGAALMVRRSAIEKAGLLDSDFFMYFEEVDWCYRIKQAGWRLVFLPDAEITHLGGRSSSQVPLKRIMTLTSLLAFFRKHRGRLSSESFAIIFKLAVILRNICHLVIGLFTLPVAWLRRDTERKQKAIEKIKLHALLLTRYLPRILKM